MKGNGLDAAACYATPDRVRQFVARASADRQMKSAPMGESSRALHDNLLKLQTIRSVDATN